jgi:deazaflavin-dependent oxidoreductase (nitroreductase family)
LAQAFLFRLQESKGMSPLRTVRPSSLPPKAVMPVVDVFVRALLHSPLHGLLSQTMLVLTYTGRKSGKRYQVPLGYRRDGDRITLVAGNSWWVNVRDGAAVTLRLAGAEVRGFAIPVQEKRQAAEALMAFIEKMPSLARMYDVTLTQDRRPDRASVEAAVNTLVVVLVTLKVDG